MICLIGFVKFSTASLGISFFSNLTNPRYLIVNLPQAHLLQIRLAHD